MTTPTPTTYADRAADATTCVAPRQWRGTGRYDVLVAGRAIGHVQRNNGAWTAHDQDGVKLTDPARAIGGGDGSSYTTRAAAVARLAHTEDAVTAYRAAVLEGVYGTREADRLRAELEWDRLNDMAPVSETSAQAEADRRDATAQPWSVDNVPPAAELAAKVRAVVGGAS